MSTSFFCCRERKGRNMIHFQIKHHDHPPLFCKTTTLQHFFCSCCNSQCGLATVATRIPFIHSSSNKLHPNSNKNVASPHCHITHPLHQLPLSVPVPETHVQPPEAKLWLTVASLVQSLVEASRAALTTPAPLHLTCMSRLFSKMMTVLSSLRHLQLKARTRMSGCKPSLLHRRKWKMIS